MGRDSHSTVQRVLIVDDSATNRQMLGDCLEADYAVLLASSGEEGLELAREHQPDVILLDVMMPEVDGYEVLRQLKEDDRTSSLCVVFITGLDTPEAEEKGLVAGASDYVTKPLHPTVVRARVALHMQVVRQRRMLETLANIDGLTELPNRRQFDGTLQKEWLRALRDGIPLGLLMIDIDRFKSLNDRFGHQTGDRFLARVGHVIRQNVRRAGDMAARYGGEEFAAVLPGTGSTGALEMAETIRRCVASADTTDIVLGGYPISVSIGVAASVPLSGSGASALVHNADAALYQAKRNGRNRVEILH